MNKKYMAKPTLGRREMITEQIPPTEEEIKREIDAAISAAGEMAEDFPEINVKFNRGELAFELFYDDYPEGEEGEKQRKNTEKALGDVIKSIEEKGFEVKWVGGGFDKFGSGDYYEVKDSDGK